MPEGNVDPQKGCNFVFACSGAADVGAISDQAARQLKQEGKAAMCCAAAIAAGIPEILRKTEDASKLLVIDGCPLNCAQTILQNAGFDRARHLQLEDLGMRKGETPPTADNVAQAARAGAEMLRA